MNQTRNPFSRKNAKAQRKTQSLLSGLGLRLCAFAREKTLALVILAITFFLFHVSAQEQKNAGGSTFSKNDITYSKEVVTPHVAWAKPLPGGKDPTERLPLAELSEEILGVTVRKTIDTVIATRCIESGYELLHNDRDFDPFAKYLGLRVVV